MPSHPYIPAPDVAQASLIYVSGGQRVENVMHFLGAAPWTSLMLGQLTDVLEAWWNTNCAPIVSLETTLELVIAVDLTVIDGPAITSSVTIQGHVTGNQLPNNCTIAIKHVTGHRGRSFRGRTYWVGLTDSQQNPDAINEILGTTATSIRNAMQLLLTLSYPNSAKPVVTSFRNGGAWRTTAVSTPIIDYQFVDQVIDSQRRRLPGHNRHR